MYLSMCNLGFSVSIVKPFPDGCLFLLITLSRHNQSYICKAIKIWFASGGSGHSPCLPL